RGRIGGRRIVRRIGRRVLRPRLRLGLGLERGYPLLRLGEIGGQRGYVRPGGILLVVVLAVHVRSPTPASPRRRRTPPSRRAPARPRARRWGAARPARAPPSGAAPAGSRHRPRRTWRRSRCRSPARPAAPCTG